ncbi:molybdenum cofactor guanylyltransferase MobA [Rhizobiaceae bacterium BDR2-2]|uniref:Molybdenum cofactor guanylyltransferase n=1 Tax=Ectorhizobium quercum TaxID=2965071 RepID=A0AAE3N1F7_9HYPH|nr:molybdenum cofactor guanylyltransferase MobA [Ectorhizobium quercum]MCX8998187.1 molybdenum cofactor guanylyltransferase MobA [Ectorhizobium quercum]
MVDRVLGVVLAGGLARRMGDGGHRALPDKGRLDLGGQSLMAEVIARLAGQCDRLVLNANGNAARFADLGLTVVPDSIAGFPGPLAGVLAGMDHAAGLGFTHVLSAAADTPFLPEDLAARLKEASALQSRPIALAATRENGRLVRHPTFGLWPVDLRADLRAALDDGVSKVVVWTDRHGTALAEFPATPVDPFFNVNTPEDLERARAIWQNRHRA